MRYVNKEDYFVLACEVIFLLFITFYVIEEILEVCMCVSVCEVIFLLFITFYVIEKILEVSVCVCVRVC